ncbi:hypothetical protein F4859DRAFT_469981 [Xylaria cf. heliscus]|nr:hypothetical protein F4859DRAFT_469981 [Xylaria cf. heliscus]
MNMSMSMSMRIYVGLAGFFASCRGGTSCCCHSSSAVCNLSKTRHTAYITYYVYRGGEMMMRDLEWAMVSSRHTKSGETML